jgi:hypothetical protein
MGADFGSGSVSASLTRWAIVASAGSLLVPPWLSGVAQATIRGTIGCCIVPDLSGAYRYSTTGPEQKRSV